MKNQRAARLVALATTILAVFGAGSASATEIYGIGGSTVGVGAEITPYLEAGTSTQFQGTSWFGGPVTIQTCLYGHLVMKIENAGGAGTHPSGKVTTFNNLNCTHQMSTLKKGEIEFQHIPGTTDAKVIWKNLEVVFMNTIFGAFCIGKSGPAAEAGTVTAATATTPATFHLNLQLTYVGSMPCGHGAFLGTFGLGSLVFEEK